MLLIRHARFEAAGTYHFPVFARVADTSDNCCAAMNELLKFGTARRASSGSLWVFVYVVIQVDAVLAQLRQWPP